LNNVLKIEYTLIVHYPRLASSIKDDEARKLALKLGTDSVRHADIVSRAITTLGGRPAWTFAPLPEDFDILQIFRIQLEKEKLALKLHRQAADLAQSRPIAAALKAIAVDEEHHIAAVELIIKKITPAK
jgi:bacterioferritin